ADPEATSPNDHAGLQSKTSSGGKRIGVGTGRTKMCATHGIASLVNRRHKYTTILGKRSQIWPVGSVEGDHLETVGQPWSDRAQWLPIPSFVVLLSRFYSTGAQCRPLSTWEIH
ncbi:hypothetical protein AnigIFM62618_002692, partial [Aspergillus niger]